MGDDRFQVVVSAGSLRPDDADGAVMPHRWTAGGVFIQADFTGAHLYHLSAAGCVLNDLYREAKQPGLEYEVEVATDAGDDAIERLLRVVDDVAEIPKALRTGTTVVRRPV